MTHRTTITLDEEAFAFLENAGGTNRSAFISYLLKKEKHRQLKKAVILANQEEASDSYYDIYLSDWECASEDGLT